MTQHSDRPGLGTGDAGFTLLEMIVAVAIFSLVSVMGYSALSQFLDMRVKIVAHGDRIGQARVAFMLLEQDLRFALPRPVRDGLGDFEPTLVSGDDPGLRRHELMRITAARPLRTIDEITRFRRVSWHMTGDSLVRSEYPVVDRGPDSQAIDRTVLEDVVDVSLRHYSFDDRGESEFSPAWRDDDLPNGMEVIMTFKDGSEYRRFFRMTDE